MSKASERGIQLNTPRKIAGMLIVAACGTDGAETLEGCKTMAPSIEFAVVETERGLETARLGCSTRNRSLCNEGLKIFRERVEISRSIVTMFRTDCKHATSNPVVAKTYDDLNSYVLRLDIVSRALRDLEPR